jgi:hypothetical protein
MKTEILKQQIATTAYDVGFGAKVGFASYDTLRLAPGVISFLAVATGITGLIWPPASPQTISAFFLILGVLGIYISSKLPDKESIENSSRILNGHFKDLGILYNEVCSLEQDPDPTVVEVFKEISIKSRESRISNPLFLSTWIAHQKFFGETQSQWVVDELNLKFWKDKVPSSLKFTTVTLFILAVAALIIRHFWICP